MKLYDVGNRDIIGQDLRSPINGAYGRHVLAMTAEALHSKSDIAAELAHRDIRIAKLERALNELLPGLILDLRYAELDDDKDAMRSRIETVQTALSDFSEPK